MLRALMWKEWREQRPVVVAGVMLIATVLITWLGFARRRVPAKSLFSIPIYLIRKLPIYLALLVKGPQRVWLRTDRPNAGRSQP